MTMCIRKKTIKVGVAAGIVGAIVSIILSMAFSGVTGPLFAENQALWKSWSAPEMYLMWLVPIWAGVFMAWFYANMDRKSPIVRCWCWYGFYIWLFVGLPGMLMTYSSFAISAALVGLWSISGLVEYMAMAWVIERMRP